MLYLYSFLKRKKEKKKEKELNKILKPFKYIKVLCKYGLRVHFL